MAQPSWKSQVVQALGKLPAVKSADPRKVGVEIHAMLREYILKGILLPGTVLSQVTVAKDLGVSRTPVREAIRMLKEEGLVTAAPNFRAQVTAVDFDDLEALYANRILLESLAISVTIRKNTAADLAELDMVLKDLGSRESLASIRTWMERHRAFHLKLYRHAGAATLAIIQSNMEKSERYQYLRWQKRAPRDQSDGGAEHRAIVEACQDRDIRAGIERLSMHLARTALETLSEIAPDREPANVRNALHMAKAGAAAFQLASAISLHRRRA